MPNALPYRDDIPGKRTRYLGLILAVWFSTTALSAEPLDIYRSQIKPLLRERCFACHGALKHEAGLRLDTVESMLKGKAITRGAPSTSPLIHRVSATNIDERMPPEHEGEPMSAEQISVLTTWIADGAPAPTDEQPEADPQDHWAFKPVIRPPIPDSGNSHWPRNPIDAFIAQGHRQHDLSPQAEASRLVLVRRLYLDLIGIPPTAEEIAVQSSDPTPLWYENLVERLLDDPRHGERWARHWMDIWRYSDWWGLNEQLRNSQMHLWHWRDWIIESLNNDVPYDEMVRLMLAADELHPKDPDALRATGYLARNFFLFNRNQWMEETVEHVGKGFLGLTFNCAKCHDHKYDPISHTDFYKLRAFFEPYSVRMDMLPGEMNLAQDGIPRVFDAQLEAPTYRLIRGEEGNPDKTTEIAPGIPDFLAAMDGSIDPKQTQPLRIEPVELPVEAWQPERNSWVLENHLAAARTKLQNAETKSQQANGNPDHAAMELAALDVHVATAELESIQRRADAMQASWSDSPEMTRREKSAAAIRSEQRIALVKAQRALAEIQLQLPSVTEDKREALEKALASAQQSVQEAELLLVAEIGPTVTYTPLVGAQWSATRFLNTGVDDPVLQFASQSTGRRSALGRWITDRNNTLTARVAVNHIWTRHLGEPLVSTVFNFGRSGSPPANPELLDWLAAEFVDSHWSMKHLHRLIVNSATYRMSSSAAGSGANATNDPDNRYLWRRVPVRLESQVVRDSILALANSLDATIGGPPVAVADQENSQRRSLYFFHSNNQRNLFLTMFDDALVTDCYRREQSIVPQQALALTNSKLVLAAAEQAAKRLTDMTDDEHEFIRNAFAVVLGIEAGDAEINASVAAMTAWRGLPGSSPSQVRANMVWVLMNHNDFVTQR